MLLIALAAIPFHAHAQQYPHLPVQPVWKGKSEKWLLPASDAQATPFEKSKGMQSASYDSMMRFYEKLAARFPQVRLKKMGETSGKQELFAILISENADALVRLHRNPNRPLVVFQSGIHSGEIDGMDAGMIFIREVLQGRAKSLLNKIDIIVIPVLNRDGLERLSSTNRINQNGPELQGWRSNARNLNLNRDFMKIDSPEVLAVVAMLQRMKPELYVDIHVTDGADYQYDITYGGMHTVPYSPEISKWLEGSLRPFIDGRLQAEGHIPGPLVFLKNEQFPDSGNLNYRFSGRFSHAYGDIAHIPSLLIENHSLKPFKQRVCGTIVLMHALCEKVISDYAQITAHRNSDILENSTQVPIEFTYPKIARDTAIFKAVQHRMVYSEIAGDSVITWNAKPYDVKSPILRQDSVLKSIPKPEGFFVPKMYTEIIERLLWHGIELQTIRHDTSVTVQVGYFESITSAKASNQGRYRMSGTVRWNQEYLELPRGSVFVSTAQDCGILATLLLHPDSPESFFQWGFFPELTERTEYFEAYAMAPLAEAMAKKHPEWKAEFDRKCASDAAFRSNPDARLRWWYERSDYHDAHYLRYPIAVK